MIHTFLPVIIDKVTGRVAYVNVAHIEQIDPTNKRALTTGEDCSCYTLADGWAIPDRQLRIGIDPDSDEITFWSGQQIRILSTQDLIQVIRDKNPDTIGHL